MWKITYDNDTGADDEAFVEWWTVSDQNEHLFKCSSEEAAKWLVGMLEKEKLWH